MPANSPAAAPSDEDELLAALRAGDAAAFETLVRSCTPRLLVVARRLLANEEEARDAVQEAFIAAFRSIRTFAGQSRLSTWLHRIVVNACLMRLRGRGRRPEESIEPLLPKFLEDGHHATPVTDWSLNAHRALEREETRAAVRGSIARLPDSLRNVLILRDIEELDTAETAQALGLTPGAVKIRLHRARQALRTLLEGRLKRG